MDKVYGGDGTEQIDLLFSSDSVGFSWYFFRALDNSLLHVQSAAELFPLEVKFGLIVITTARIQLQLLLLLTVQYMACPVLLTLPPPFVASTRKDVSLFYFSCGRFAEKLRLVFNEFLSVTGFKNTPILQARRVYIHKACGKPLS